MMKHFQTKILSIRRISPEAHHVQPLVGAHISGKEKLINYFIKHPKLFQVCPHCAQPVGGIKSLTC